MKRRSFWGMSVCALVTFALCAGSFTTPTGAVIRNKNNSSNSSSNSTTDSNSGSKSNSNSNSNSTTDSNSNSNSNSTTDSNTTTDSNATTDSNSNKNVTTSGGTLDEGSTSNASGSDSANATTSGSKSSSKSTTTSKSSTKSSTPKIDANGNIILMTDAQRRNKWRSKTNPKRDIKPAPKAIRPAQNGFTYADFGTCNSYNSENGLGGNYVYLLGTITDIEKVYENTLYYGVAVMVNDCDGYQWYMRVNIAKAKFDMFKGNFLGKTGYIYGIYSGYSGVTDRPMMDIRVIYPMNEYMIDMKFYQ